MNLNELRDAAYKNACDKGFHDKEYSDEHWLCLVNGELEEAVEADRSGKRARTDDMQETIEAGGFCDGFYLDYIKGTVEEELADSVIRLLDFAGLKGFDMNFELDDIFADEESVCASETFTETIYAIMEMPCRLHYEYGYNREKQVVHMISSIFELADYLEIDLFKHIELKMKYNLTRSAMHGKKY